VGGWKGGGWESICQTPTSKPSLGSTYKEVYVLGHNITRTFLIYKGRVSQIVQ